MGNGISWGGADAFTHMLVVGPTRCGKTATILKPMIYQILLEKKRGKQVGLSVIEPKGDVARMVKDMCDVMDLPCTYIDPESGQSDSFNVMEGNKDDVAEAAVVVLQGLFGKQEAFFQTVQELSTRNITKLLKELYGDEMDIMDVLYTLRDQKLLEKQVKKLRERDGGSDLVQFFENELLGSLADQYRKLVIGLRAQLENITSNDLLRKVITGRSDLDIDRHFEEGGVLAVNTALGRLRKAGDAFGQFVIMHLQNGTFRRKGTESSRIPHFLIVDEYSRYINPDVEMFLSIAAEYRVAGIFATQSLGQLELESGKINAKAMKAAILTSCRNKIAFGGLSATDAKEFAEEFGKDQILTRQPTYKNRFLLPSLTPASFRDTEGEEYRFHFTYLMDGMPRFHYVYKILSDGKPQQAAEGKGSFIPHDWKEKIMGKRAPGMNIKESIRMFLNKFRSEAIRKEEQTADIGSVAKGLSMEKEVGGLDSLPLDSSSENAIIHMAIEEAVPHTWVQEETIIHHVEDTGPQTKKGRLKAEIESQEPMEEREAAPEQVPIKRDTDEVAQDHAKPEQPRGRASSVIRPVEKGMGYNDNDAWF
jgi:hypothetical protein